MQLNSFNSLTTLSEKDWETDITFLVDKSSWHDMKTKNEERNGSSHASWVYTIIYWSTELYMSLPKPFFKDMYIEIEWKSVLTFCKMGYF